VKVSRFAQLHTGTNGIDAHHRQRLGQASVTFVQKAVGYSLTGDISEQVFFFVYGRSGNNGKSTFVNLIREMLGDYGLHTQTETLLVKQYDNAIPADLARLAGARIVTAIEANPNRHLEEAKIKGMTGGEPIAARFMRQNLFPVCASIQVVVRRQ
jgi:putative DNA primase/helicase